MVEYRKDLSDEERTNNQSYFTELATHVLNYNYCNVILVNWSNSLKLSDTNKLPGLSKVSFFIKDTEFEGLACNEKIGPARPILAAKTGPLLPILVPPQKM